MGTTLLQPKRKKQKRNGYAPLHIVVDNPKVTKSKPQRNDIQASHKAFMNSLFFDMLEKI